MDIHFANLIGGTNNTDGWCAIFAHVTARSKRTLVDSALCGKRVWSDSAVFTIFPHTADAGIRVEAPDTESLFAEAGRGLFSLIVTNLSDIQPTTKREISVAGEDLEYLFFDWLSELLFLFEKERLLLNDFDVSIHTGGLQAEALGEPIDHARHQMEHEIKAITYHGLKVQRCEQGWIAEVIVDI